MRLATSMIFQRGVSAMLDQQSQLSKTELQLATGKRVLTPQDDPTATARILDLNREVETVTQHQRNIERVKSRLELEDATLMGSVNLLQRVRELTVQAASDTLNAQDRAALGFEVEQMRDALVGLANTKDANGEFIFAGFIGNATPAAFVREEINPPSGIFHHDYKGDDGQRLIRIAYERKIADGDSGFEVFEDISTTLQRDDDADGVLDPATTRSALDTLDMLSNLLQGGSNYPTAAAGPGGVASADVISNYLTEIDAIMSKVLDVQAKVGARQNAIDEQEMVNEDFLLVMETTRSNENDLDYAEAVSRFQQQLVALEASQQSFIKIQDLNLFKFI